MYVCQLNTRPLELVGNITGNGTQPCTNCFDRNLECVIFARSSTKSRHRSMDKTSVTDRLARVEALLQQNHTEHIDPSLETVASYHSCNQSNAQANVTLSAPWHMSKGSPVLIFDNRKMPPDSETLTQESQFSQTALQSPPFTESSGMQAELNSPGNHCSPTFSDSNSLRIVRHINPSFTSQRLSESLNMEQQPETESMRQSIDPITALNSSIVKDSVSGVDESDEGGSIFSNELVSDAQDVKNSNRNDWLIASPIGSITVRSCYSRIIPATILMSKRAEVIFINLFRTRHRLGH